MSQGRLITIEGGEGVGKTLFATHFSAALAEMGINFSLGREPGGTPSAERIRQFWANSPSEEPWLAMTELCLVSAARAQHIGRRIRPELQAGRWYLSDRFADSSRVYQGCLGGLPPTEVEAIIAASTGGLEPDLTLLLDCPVAIAQARIAKGRAARGAGAPVERYDQATVAVHEQIRAAFLELARREPSRILVLDAAGPVEASVAMAVAAVKRLRS